MTEAEFRRAFSAVAGTEGHFPWQWALYQQFVAGNFPRSCNLPTGLGKTSVIHIWLLALANAPDHLPRRLVYVVNRRTVVDQSTDEAWRLRDRLGDVNGLTERLRALCANGDPDSIPLAISTLRGQFADNREWSTDPARPAIIAGTVDMIGSRLLFSGYGCGFKSRPLHAGFLGQDALLVHDEAHLEPAFQELITAIENEQRHGRMRDFRPLRVLELTATSRIAAEPPFTLTAADRANETVRRRIYARKGLTFHEVADEKQVADRVAALALGHKDSEQAILVFVSTIDAVTRVHEQLRKAKQGVQLLTGTIRGYERDQLPKDEIFVRFLPESSRPPDVKAREGTVYLLCTSAGEVGVNLSADHLACDLTTFESMAQRLGRVNRFGSGDAQVDIVHPKEFNSDGKPREAAREKTLALLGKLPRRDDGRHDASPQALAELPAAERQEAFSPAPEKVLPTDVLLDTWALTTVRDRLPGRPPVAEYLHGKAEGEPPETYVAWRDEVELFKGSALTRAELGELLEGYRLKPQELLRDNSERVYKHLVALAKDHGERLVWLVDEDDVLEVVALDDLVKDKERIQWQTVVLPSCVGGLTREGTLGFGEPPAKYDVADEWRDDRGPLRQRRTVDEADVRMTTPPPGMRRMAAVPLRPLGEEEAEANEEEVPAGRRVRLFFVRTRAADDDGSRTASGRVELATHHVDTEAVAARLARQLLPEELWPVLTVAARYHDLGKDRDLWQRSIGNTDMSMPLAKSGTSGFLRELNGYRHEFGSIRDIATREDFMQLTPDQQELVLHLLGSHHGRSRPLFVANEAFDTNGGEGEAQRLAREVPRRYARLQRKYGRWGLAWLESLLRAADATASANPSEVRDD